LVNQAVSGEEADQFACMMSELFNQAGLCYGSVIPFFLLDKNTANYFNHIRWVADLPDRLHSHGFDVLHASNKKFHNDLIQLCTSTYLMAISEIIRGIERNSIANDSIISVSAHEEALSQLLQNTKDGMVYNWIPITVLGQKRE
jgi:hypothetical protein